MLTHITMTSYNSGKDIQWRPSLHKLTKSTISALPLYYKDKPQNSVIASFWWNPSKRRTLIKWSTIVVLIYLVFRAGSGLFFRSDSELLTKQNQIKNAFIETYGAYESLAWGKDQFFPVSKKGANLGPGPLGLIILDSLDSLYIMGLQEEIKLARSWIENELSFDLDFEIETYEATARLLGGLLSAYYLSDDDLYLNKATDLGNRILNAFETPRGIALPKVNLVKAGLKEKLNSTAGSAGLQLEFKYLSQLTGEALYWEKVEKAMEVIFNENNQLDGLVPVNVDSKTGQFYGSDFKLGNRGETYYEFALKQYLQTGELIYLRIYKDFSNGLKAHLIERSRPGNWFYVGEKNYGLVGYLNHTMRHSSCYIGGLLALGVTKGTTLEDYRDHFKWTTPRDYELQIAQNLTDTCHYLYNTGLAPDAVAFNFNDAAKGDIYVSQKSKFNSQLAETVESLFVLYRITKNPIYRQQGWEIFEKFIKYSKLPDNGGFAGVREAAGDVKFVDKLESQWLSETLKYLYLLFEEDEEVLSLEKVVFNSAGHAFPRIQPKFKTGWAPKIDVHEDPYEINTNQINFDVHAFRENERAIENNDFHEIMKTAGRELADTKEKTLTMGVKDESPQNNKETKQIDETLKNIEQEEERAAESKEEYLKQQMEIHRDINDAPAAAKPAEPLDDQVEKELQINEDSKLIKNAGQKYS